MNPRHSVAKQRRDVIGRGRDTADAIEFYDVLDPEYYKLVQSNMTLHEEVVLAPKNPWIEDDNQWPEFRLSEVTVYRPDGLSLASLLTPSNQSPVLVRGYLDEVDNDQERLGMQIPQ